MALPVLTTVDDLKGVVDYLRGKAAGATLQEARSVLGRRYFDGRKVSAYQFWGVVTEEGGALNLTSLGRRGARSDEEFISMIRAILARVRAYNMALEWIYRQGFDVVDTAEVGAWWRENTPEEVQTDKETTLRYNAVCLFRLAERAGLGSVVAGGGTKLTRLRVNREELAEFVEGQAALPEAPGEAGLAEEQLGVEPPVTAPGAAYPIKVFIAHSKNEAILADIKRTVDLAGFEWYVAEEEETPALPIPEKVADGMRQCNSAIINVSADQPIVGEDGQETFKVNENALIEVGAAGVRYGYDRIILLWDRRVPVPSNLQGLYRCEYEGDRLDLETAFKLMEAMKRFRA